MRLYFNDEKKVVQLDTPAGNSITLSEDDKSIEAGGPERQQDRDDADGIRIESAKALELKAGTELKLEEAGAELSSSATCKVQGSIVQIN